MRSYLSKGLVALLAFIVSSPLFADTCNSKGERIIALGGTVTEIIYALGEEKRLVGVDTTSSFPAATSELPKLGYYRAVSAEGLLSLAPDLIIADADAGPDVILDQVSKAGVCIIRTPDGGTMTSVTARVHNIANALGTSGEALSNSIEGAFSAIRANVEALSDKPRVMFVLSAANGTPVVAGSGTEADSIIKLAGGINAAGSIEKYKPLTPEAAIAAKPDFILMMDHVVMQSGGPDKILSIPQIAMTPAGKLGNLISMDGLLMLGFGPRTPEAISVLANKIHPNIDIASR
jgi:iron complex transport system substrate-binding protein